ncbi:MAG: ATP-NAD kinase family protein [Euryarchaeota archaeon]|nr:ATP-NAD kinase family protein [Euryarchaeota archaeon]
MLLGFVVNPIAGMGGSVALKGTDGDSYREAVTRGAVPVAQGKATRALAMIEGDVRFLTASGEMGASVLAALGQEHEVVFQVEGESGAEDTRRTCQAFLDRGVDLIVFCGGDGTARDVLDVVGDRVPVIGIPAGVKMHSGVFANSPEEAGKIISAFLAERSGTRMAEVMDVDEEAFRKGEVRARPYGYMKVPALEGIQPPKGAVFGTSDREQKEAIAEYVVERMDPGTLYILGPGTTTKAVADRMGRPKTLLGVDAYLAGEIVLSDATESDLLHAINGRRTMLLLTPIGRQGFILGRGNQQLSPRVIEAVGTANVLILATPTKLAETQVLRVDSGDAALDERLRGFRRVLIGYDQFRMVRCC